MSHSQLMLKGRLSAAWPLALTISLSTCVWPFWRRVSSLGFPISFKRAFARVLANLSRTNDFCSKEAKYRAVYYPSIVTACRLKVSKYYWPIPDWDPDCAVAMLYGICRNAMAYKIVVTMQQRTKQPWTPDKLCHQILLYVHIPCYLTYYLATSINDGMKHRQVLSCKVRNY